MPERHEDQYEDQDQPETRAPLLLFVPERHRRKTALSDLRLCLQITFAESGAARQIRLLRLG